jgi:hypothetical protein
MSNLPVQETRLMPVTVTIDTPGTHQEVPAAAMFEANGKVTPTTAILSAKIRHADNAELRGMQVPANPGHDWTFRFDGVPTGEWVTLAVHAFDLEAADGAEASRTFRLVSAPECDGASLAPENNALAMFAATPQSPDSVLERPPAAFAQEFASPPADLPATAEPVIPAESPQGETPPPAEVTPPVFPTAPTVFPVIPPSVVVDAELVVTSEPPAATSAEPTSPRKRSRPAVRKKAQMPKKAAKAPARKAVKGPARKAGKAAAAKKSASKKATPTPARKETRTANRKAAKAGARKEAKAALKKAGKTSPKKLTRAKAGKATAVTARAMTKTAAKKSSKAAAKTHPKRRTSR